MQSDHIEKTWYSSSNPRCCAIPWAILINFVVLEFWAAAGSSHFLPKDIFHFFFSFLQIDPKKNFSRTIIIKLYSYLYNSTWINCRKASSLKVLGRDLEQQAAPSQKFSSSSSSSSLNFSLASANKTLQKLHCDKSFHFPLMQSWQGWRCHHC